MKMSCVAAAVVLFATGFSAAADPPTCPPPLEYTEERGILRDAIRTARNDSAGRLLTRELAALRRIAPDGRAQRLLDKGISAMALRDHATALGSLNALVAYCPDYANGWYARATAYLAKGDLDAALGDLDHALALDADHAPAHAARAVTLWQLGDFAGAQDALSAALALNPWLPERRLVEAIPGPAA